jgi:hypothetical protein
MGEMQQMQGPDVLLQQLQMSLSLVSGTKTFATTTRSLSLFCLLHCGLRDQVASPIFTIPLFF